MILRTRLMPSECISRLQHLGSADPRARAIVRNPKYCFPNGDPRISVDMNGIDFTVEVWGRRRYGGMDVLASLVGTIIEDDLNGGSVIRGNYGRTFFSCLPFLSLILFAICGVALWSEWPLQSDQHWKAAGSVSFGVMGLMMLYGYLRNRALAKSLLKDVLEAT